MKVIDLTHTVSEGMPVYPGTKPPEFVSANDYESDGFKETLLQIYTHTGTHIDPPSHIYADRTALDMFSAERFIGKALVIDCRNLNDGEEITVEMVNGYGDKALNADFLLFNTGWDKRW